MSNETTSLVAADNERIMLALTNTEARAAIIDEVKQHLAAFTPDTTTDKGRKAIASIAYRVARTKTTIDDVGKGMVAEAKAKIKVVDEARKELRDTLDGLRDEARKPLTEYEAKIAADKEQIKRIADNIILFAESGSEYLQKAINDVRDWDPNTVDESLTALAYEVSSDTIEKLEALKLKAIAREAEQAKIEAERAELERLRQIERDRRAEEDKQRIIQAAAERARVQAEQEAARKIQEAEQRAKAAEIAANQAAIVARQEAEAKQRAETAAEAARQADRENRSRKMNEAYHSILQIINVTFGEGLNNAKIAEHLVREIAAGNVKNVRMEW